MTPSLKDDLGRIGQEILRVASEKFTGQLTMVLHMKQGGIGQIEVNIQKNLKGNRPNSPKNKTS